MHQAVAMGHFHRGGRLSGQHAGVPARHRAAGHEHQGRAKSLSAAQHAVPHRLGQRGRDAFFHQVLLQVPLDQRRVRLQQLLQRRMFIHDHKSTQAGSD